MAAYDEKVHGAKIDKTVEINTRSVIEQIFYYENLDPRPEADNDNTKSVSKQHGSECFESWAMPDFVKR